MDEQERRLVEPYKHLCGHFGGFSFGGGQPEGVRVHNPLPSGTVFPNGAAAALLLTFDVEGDYGNGIGDVELEVSNYSRICARLADRRLPATFNVLGQMAQEKGPGFVQQMIAAGCEVSTHGYVHDLNKRHGGDRVYAGHYGLTENLQQIRDGVEAINKIKPGVVGGARVPYGHFNEYTYEAIEKMGLAWASNVGIDDYLTAGQGFGWAPFQMKLGEKVFHIVEIPLDTQTYDWPIWIADEHANAPFVEAVRRYCEIQELPFQRTPAGGAAIWRRRMKQAVEQEGVFALVCHPINLTVHSNRWTDPVVEFLFPVIDVLAELHHSGQAWVCTCSQLAGYYWQAMASSP